MDVDGLVEAIRQSEGNPWVAITIHGDSARVVMRNGEVRSAVGLEELKKVLGVNAQITGSAHKR